MTKKFCPIQTTEYGSGTRTECTKKDCAWWENETECCAILSLALGIGVLSECAEQVPGKPHWIKRLRLSTQTVSEEDE